MKPTLLIGVIVLLAAALGLGYFIISSNPGPGQTAPSAPMVATPPPIDINDLKTRATAGDPAAQTKLAQALIEGNGVKPSAKEALKWLQQATNQNYVEAFAVLGECAQAGQGMKSDLAEAARLFKLAADQGSVAGQYNLAYLYEQGTGVTKDEALAAHWYQLAAEGGDPIAQFDLGQRYHLGVGVTADPVQAYQWLALAAAQGQADSVKLLAEVKNSLSADQLTQATARVAAFKPRAAK